MKYFLNGKIDKVSCSRALELDYKENVMKDTALFSEHYKSLPAKTVMLYNELEWKPLSETIIMHYNEGIATYDLLPKKVQEYLKRALKKDKYKELLVDFFIDVCFLMIICLTFLYTNELSFYALFFGCGIAGIVCFILYGMLTWET